MSEQEGEAQPTAPPPRRRRLWLAMLVIVLVGLLGAAVAARMLSDDGADLRASDRAGRVTSTTSPSSTAAAVATTGAPTTTASPSTTTTTLPPLGASKVTLTGIGAVRIGMTVAEASRAARVELRAEDSSSPDCHYVSPVEGAEGLSFMVVGGTIARIDVYQGDIRTRSGVGIGTSEQQVMDIYPGRIEVSSHPYDETGHYLTFVPRDAADRAYRLIFETDGRAVTSLRSGRLPEVDFIEGCS